MAEYENEIIATDDFGGLGVEALGYQVETEELEEEGVVRLMRYMALDNIADELELNELQKIGQQAKDDYETDYDSLEDWRDQNEDALKLAKQVRETKSFPWVGASNVKFPLISQAAMNFNARAYPEIVQGDKVVKAVVVGEDPTQSKADRAERISDHMSYQLTQEIPNWEQDTDKLLIQLPIVGTMFKEVTWDEINEIPEINLLLPNEITVNYFAKSLDLIKCRRISKEVVLFKNDILERERAGLWRKIDYTTQSIECDDNEAIEEDEQTFIQQLRYLDLDDDGYEEPYVVTFLKESGEVVRIVANYDLAGVQYNAEDNSVVKITPIQIYTDYHFIPAFDGAFYSIGFGSYLYPINQSIDTLINQLIDAGTLSNTQGGFLGKGIRQKMGSSSFKPGEWKPVDSKGMDIHQNIVPLPTKEPSMTLFNLLQALIGIGKDMSSITDIMAGVPQGQNTPVGTTLSMIEQGMKVIDAIYKRIYRSLKAEFKMLYRVNSIYLEDGIYTNILDMQASVAADYNMTDFDIVPVGDTRISSQVMRTMKAQAARDLAATTPGADMRAATMRVFEAMDIPNPKEILPEGPSVEALQAQFEELTGYAEAMTNEMQRLTQQLNGSEEERKNKEIGIKLAEAEAKIKELQSKVALNMASVAEKLADTEGQNIDNQKELQNG